MKYKNYVDFLHKKIEYLEEIKNHFNDINQLK